MSQRKTLGRLLACFAAAIMVSTSVLLSGCTSCSSAQPANEEAVAKKDSTKKKASTEEKKEEEKEYTVPNVVSLTQSDAEKAILASGLRMGKVTNKESDTVPRGSVISQSPKGLTNAKADSKVDLVVSKGKQEAKDVKVPDLKGKTQADAEKLLQEQKLVGVAATPQESSEVQPGQVFKQSIAAGTVVKEGARVEFTVALAPSTVKVPNLVGLTSDEAHAALTAAGLGFDHTAAYNDRVPNDKVISQSIAAETSVKSGTTVSVVVSLGKKPEEKVAVPNVLTYSWHDAEATLESAGLTARYTGDPAGDVVAQDIEPGTMVDPNTMVTVTLEKSAVMVTVPDLVGMSPSSAEDILGDLNLVLDLDGGIHGTIVSQSPEAGAQVEERTTVTAVVDSSDFGWNDASSASKAAKGAGLSSFSVEKNVYAGDTNYSNPTYAYITGVAQAFYEGAAAGVVIRKSDADHASKLSDLNRDAFAARWNINFKGQTITCYGDSKGAASVAIWNIGDEWYGITYQGFGGETVTMDEDEVSSIAFSVQ